MAAKHVVVDGSNIATEGRTVPSLGQLDEAVRSFVASHPHDKVTVVVDATFGHRIPKSDREGYEEAVLAGELVSPPAGAVGRGDAFVLQIADQAGATVLSNDSFQEFHGQYAWLFDEGRLMGGKPVPDVGWIFVPRTPVRGPTSRRATKDALKTEKSARTAKKRSGPKPKIGSVANPGRESSPPATTPAGAGPSGADGSPNGQQAKSTEEAKPVKKAAGRRSRRKTTSGGELLNDAMAFIEFVGDHPIGSGVDATVDRFSSHGAYVVADGAQCYVPLRNLADPPPNSARKVLSAGETREFVVVSFNTERRGIDLALPDVADAALTAAAAAPTGDQTVSDREPDEGLPTSTKQAAHAEEGPSVAPAKKTAKRSSTKKAAKKKSAAKKSTAKKSTSAKKSAAGKKGAAARKKKAAKRSTAAKKGAATRKKAAAKRSTAAKKGAATRKKAAAKKR